MISFWCKFNPAIYFRIIFWFCSKELLSGSINFSKSWSGVSIEGQKSLNDRFDRKVWVEDVLKGSSRMFTCWSSCLEFTSWSDLVFAKQFGKEFILKWDILLSLNRRGEQDEGLCSGFVGLRSDFQDFEDVWLFQYMIPAFLSSILILFETLDSFSPSNMHSSKIN